LCGSGADSQIRELLDESERIVVRSFGSPNSLDC